MIDRVKIIEMAVLLPPNMRSMLDDWETFDEDLCEHYAEDFEWVLRQIGQYADDPKVIATMKHLKVMSKEIESKLGVALEE